MRAAMTRMNLSARAYHRILKLRARLGIWLGVSKLIPILSSDALAKQTTDCQI